jgi:hypothetical protein
MSGEATGTLRKRLHVRFASLKDLPPWMSPLGRISGTGALALEWREDDQQKVMFTTKCCRSIEEKCARAFPQ